MNNKYLKLIFEVNLSADLKTGTILALFNKPGNSSVFLNILARRSQSF